MCTREVRANRSVTYVDSVATASMQQAAILAVRPIYDNDDDAAGNANHIVQEFYDQIENLAAAGIQPLVPPDGQNPKRTGANRKGPRYDFMRRVIASDHGRVLYSKRKHTIEPIFGQIKHNRRIARFQRRGITACRSEWRLIATTHNILKLWKATSAAATA